MLRIACPMWPKRLGIDSQCGLCEMMENLILYFQVTDADSLWSLTHYLTVHPDLFHRATLTSRLYLEDIWKV